MTVVLWIVVCVSFVLVLGCTILLLGLLRRVELLTWRLEQLEYRSPRRIGRDGLRAGTKAPDFTLEAVNGQPVTLSQFRGQEVLLVYTQEGCGPCHSLLGELRGIPRNDRQIVILNQGDREAAEELQQDTKGLVCHILIQPDGELSRKYEAFATPFLFLIDRDGIVVSRGIAHTRQQVQFILDREGFHGAMSVANSAEADPVA